MNEQRDILRSRLSMLMECGADQFNPIQFGYIESLAQRATKKQETVCRLIERKALKALVDYQNHFDQARTDAEDIMTRVSLEYPNSAAQANRLFEECDFKGLQRLAGRLRRGNSKGALVGLSNKIAKTDTDLGEKETSLSFDDFLKKQEEKILQSVEDSMADEGPSQRKNKMALKTFSLFKETWAKFHSERLVNSAIKGRPENAGPLNSQMLVTRSLFTAQNISPNYLKRFISYIETLLWIEQAD